MPSAEAAAPERKSSGDQPQPQQQQIPQQQQQQQQQPPQQQSSTLNSSQPDILHPQKAPTNGRRIFHYEEPPEKKRGQTFLDRFFQQCSGKSRRSRSFMIVTEQPSSLKKSQPSGAATTTNGTQAAATPANPPKVSIVLPAASSSTGSLHQQQVQKVEVHTTTMGQDVHPKKLLPASSIRELPGSDGEVNNGNTVSFQKNTNNPARRSRGSLYYRERASNTNIMKSSVSEKSIRASAIVKGTSPTLVEPTPGFQQTSTELFEVSSRSRQKSKASPERVQTLEVEEIDLSRPSLDPVVITGQQQQQQMVNSSYNSANYYSASMRRSRSREAVMSSYYATTEDYSEPHQPTASAAVNLGNNNFNRSRSMHLRTSTNPVPVAATIQAPRSSLTSVRRPQPKTNPIARPYQSASLQRPRSPSPLKRDDVTRLRLQCTHDMSQSRKKISYAPAPPIEHGETISVGCAKPRPAPRPSPSRPPQQHQIAYHHPRPQPPSAQHHSPHRSSVRSEVPSIPVGSKIDVTMRSNGQLIDESANKRSASVRYTYETEYEEQQRASQDEYRQTYEIKPAYIRPAPTMTDQQPSQYAVPHPQPRRTTSQQYSSGPTKVQVGEMGEDYRNLYHAIEPQKSKPRPPQEPVYHQPERPKSPVYQSSRTTYITEEDNTPVKERRVVVTKQVNKKVIDALANTRKKLDQLDDDLDAALKRLQSRNNRSETLQTTSSTTRQMSSSIKASSRQQQTTTWQPEPTYAVPIQATGDLTIHSKVPSRRQGGHNERYTETIVSPSSTSLPYGSNIVLITIADDGHEERFEENEQLIFSHSPPVREVMIRQPPRKVEVKKEKGPDQYDFTDKNVAVVSAHGTIGHIFHQLTHGKLPDFVHQRFNVEHSEEEIHNDDVDLVQADGTKIGRIEDFQNLDTIYELINMGIENSQAKVCFKVTCQRIEPVNPRAGIWKRKSVTASRVLNIDLSQNDELKGVLHDIQSAPGESVRMIMSHDVDSSSNVTTREKHLDNRTTAWAVAEILGKTVDQQGPAPISPRQTEGNPMKFLSPSKFAEEVYNTDILGQNSNAVAVPFSTRRTGSNMANKPWTSSQTPPPPPPAYRPSGNARY